MIHRFGISAPEFQEIKTLVSLRLAGCLIIYKSKSLTILKQNLSLYIQMTTSLLCIYLYDVSILVFADRASLRERLLMSEWCLRTQMWTSCSWSSGKNHFLFAPHSWELRGRVSAFVQRLLQFLVLACVLESLGWALIYWGTLRGWECPSFKDGVMG